jgi:rhodanese-related sulfurtransferase
VKYLALALVFATGYVAANISAPNAAADPPPNSPSTTAKTGVPNPAIDMQGYLKVAQEAAKHRDSRRISEEDFIKMSAEEGTIVLDARSKEMYDLLHIKGAINMSFPDIAIDSLAKKLPDKNARILIYCNNNFDVTKLAAQTKNAGTPPVGEKAPPDARAARAFAPKMATASLNISTYIALYNYGYKNVYELAPLLDPEKSKLTFESTVKK